MLILALWKVRELCFTVGKPMFYVVAIVVACMLLDWMVDGDTQLPSIHQHTTNVTPTHYARLSLFAAGLFAILVLSARTLEKLSQHLVSEQEVAQRNNELKRTPTAIIVWDWSIDHFFFNDQIL